MRVLLISANTERISMVTLALGASLVAAAAERAGHELTFLDLLFVEDLAGAVRDAIALARPDVIGISVRNIDDQNRQEPHLLLDKVKEVTAECRACSAAPIVLGGAGYSIFPREVLEFLGADFGIRGDGEAAFPALLQRLQEGRDPRDIPGVYVAGDTGDGGLAVVEKLDALPLWNETLSDRTAPAPDLCVPIQTRRGCPNDCSYCSTARIQGRPIRCASPAAAAETLAHLAEQGFHHFHIVDNCFNLPEAHAFELCRHIRERDLGITWRCILYPHLVGEELVDAMKEAGCTEVSLGFESGCARILKELNKRFLPWDVRFVSDRLAARGIHRMGFLLLGGPGETRESVEESLAFVQSLELEELMITVGIRIYPHTALARRAVSEGVIAPGEDLLRPRFYLAPGLEPWIHERVAAFTASAT
jgi:radical SAM superfamily enzyme YgiQ (UPF0313 family)